MKSERGNKPVWETSCGNGRSAEEIEQIVVMQRLSLYNRGHSCGAKAVREHLDEWLGGHPVPSERTIERILKRHGLTHGRTGHYEGEA